MRHAPSLLALALAVCSVSQAFADIQIDEIAGSRIYLQGLLQGDANWFDNDRVDLNGGGSGDGDDSEFEMRRAEFVVLGKGERFDWQLGYDAKASKFLDASLRYKWGSAWLQAGQYKQMNSLEELTSTRHNDFIAKSMATNLFGVARRLGVAAGADRGDHGFSFGWFGRELTRNLAHGAGWAVRGYYAPINEDGRFLHLGLSAVDYDTDADTSRVRVRPAADFATVRLLDSGSLLNTDRQRTLGLEGAYVQGPFKLQGEYLRSRVSRYDTPFASQPGADYDAASWYLQGLWNVTGETWTYKSGVPATASPATPAGGMWQLGLRYDGTDLDDGAVRGGEGHNLTLGVNWYWRTNFKFMVNYVAATSEKFNRSLAREVGDDPNILEARVQVYW